MSYTQQLEGFISGYLASQGAVIDRPAYGILEAVLDKDLESRLGREHLTLAFDYDSAQEFPGSQYATFGNALCEKVVQIARDKHVVAKRYVMPQSAGPANLEKKAAEHLNVRQAGIMVNSVKLYLSHCWRFQFKLAYLADQREEVLVYVWIDGHTGKEIQTYARQRHIFFESTKPELIPELPCLALGKLFSAATDSLDSHSYKRRQELEVVMRSQLTQDGERIQSYFAAMAMEYKAKLAKATIAGEEKQCREIENKLASIENQKRHHMDDIVARHRVRCEASLIDLVAYIVPRWRIKASLNQYRSTEQETITLWWDQVLNGFLPLQSH